MFRAQQNAFDDAVGKFYPLLASVSLRSASWFALRSSPSARTCQTITDAWFLLSAKATDENLTSENWEYILVRFFERRQLHCNRGAQDADGIWFCGIGCL